MRRTFKEYEAMWEDAAANSVGGGGVAMPADMMPKVMHKRHKKKVRMYDGRTKEAKAFLMFAFAGDTLKNITIPELKIQLINLVARELKVDLELNEVAL